MKRLLVLASSFLAPLVLHAEQPNVVVILTDDQGWGDLSLNGNTNLSTPNIDSLAAEGAMFEHFYVCPVCSPTRAEFLTGRYHMRGGVYSTSEGGERLDLDEMTIGDVFRGAGYSTAAFGKWHNGMQYPYHPNGRGFDEFYGFCSGHWGHYFSPMLEHNGEIVKGEGFVIDDFTNRAMDFIEKNKEKQFFVYLPYNTPHSPMQVPDEYWDRFKDKEIAMHHDAEGREEDLHLRCALAMCENIDWNVGRLLAKLDELDLAENTIVLYFCDNGPNGYRWNGGMKGKKGSTEEGGVRSPLLIRWPAQVAAGTKVERVGGAIDLLPTLAEMAGIEFESRKPLDGISLAKEIIGTGSEIPDRTLFTAWRGKYSSRTQEYRLSHDAALYHIPTDQEQDSDLADEEPELHAKLSQELKRWSDEMEKELGSDTRPFTIAHPGHRFTQIPARDGEAHGNIRRSNKFPNDSYFENWSSTDDKITWTAEVAEGGKFEVAAYYTCDPENVGSTIELSFGDSKMTAEVMEAHPSPLIGEDQDRAPRSESYTQDWTPMTLGMIDLPKGKGDLTLRATRIPGKEVMDFRLLLLKRVD